jgi:hypothetical protein
MVPAAAVVVAGIEPDRSRIAKAFPTRSQLVAVVAAVLEARVGPEILVLCFPPQQRAAVAAHMGITHILLEMAAQAGH